MSEISSISAGLMAKNTLTQLNISTAVMKNIVDTQKQMAELLANLSQSAPVTPSKSGLVDIYV
ncbi:MAG: hypothetical protein N3A62_01850 [Thermodesulfovibrionales bacterium]|nr:hypothetical protein [Thermodesulfovibrionales bacterium]